MRKQYKKKKRSCAMCKPWKMAKENRWTKKDRRFTQMEETLLRRIFGEDESTD